MNHPLEQKLAPGTRQLVLASLLFWISVSLAAAPREDARLEVSIATTTLDASLLTQIENFSVPHPLTVAPSIRARTNDNAPEGTVRRIPVEAIASGSAHELHAQLVTLGLEHGQIDGRLVSGLFPEDAINSLNQLSNLHDVRSGTLRYAAGLVNSEGDRAMNADAARETYGVTGAGVTIGVVSDSFDCLGGAVLDKLNDELPDSAQVLKEIDNCDGALDEGRALMQIIHDVAPGSELIFHSGGNGASGVTNAFEALADRGVDIILDDAKAPFATFFQNDAIARRVIEDVSRGIVHVTAAGNDGRNGYESTFRPKWNPVFTLSAHDFESGDTSDVLQRFQLPEGQSMELILQWDEPAFSNSGSPGSGSDLDIFVTDDEGRSLLSGAATKNIGRDPIEFLTFFNPSRSGQEYFNLLIVHADGPAPGLIKYIIQGRFEGQVLENTTSSSTVYGHANIDASISVGAVEWSMTPIHGLNAPLLRPFSSAGGGAILFDDNGARYLEPQVANKPDIAAPDGVTTTFFNGSSELADGASPEFVGSSASAPHVAGVVALLLERRPDLSPQHIQQILFDSAVDIIERDSPMPGPLPVGFDSDSGHGLVDARQALEIAENFSAEAINNNTVQSPAVIVTTPALASVGGASGPLLLSLMLIVFPLRRRSDFIYTCFLHTCFITFNTRVSTSNVALDSLAVNQFLEGDVKS